MEVKTHSAVRSVKTMPVIEIMVVAGSNRPDDPKRVVIQYWDFDGNLLAVNDPINDNNNL
mgnify:FL=1